MSVRYILNLRVEKLKYTNNLHLAMKGGQTPEYRWEFSASISTKKKKRKKRKSMKEEEAKL